MFKGPVARRRLAGDGCDGTEAGWRVEIQLQVEVGAGPWKAFRSFGFCSK